MRGLGFGAFAAVIIIAGSWLSPLAASDRPALALLAVTLSVPLGCAVATRPTGLRDAGGVGVSALLAALVLSSSVNLFDPSLWVRTTSWCVAGGLIGASCSGIMRGGGLTIATLWLFLCGLPFFADAVPVFTETAETWAVEACPWIGFSADAFGGDPLRRPVFYMGQLSPLTDASVEAALSASTMWLVALFTFVSLLAASLTGQNVEQTKADTPVMERAGA